MEMLMNDLLQKLEPQTSQDIPNATSLPVSADGATPYNLQDGQQTNPCGQEAVLVSHSVPQENKKVKKTQGICGQCGSALSVNPDRQLCLANKCQPQFAIIGGTMWPMIWKEKVTPRGRKLGQLVVSVRRTSETDCGLWATPNTLDHMADRSLDAMERQFQTTRKGRTAPANLREQVNPVMWPTPRVFCHKDAKTDRGKYNLGEMAHGLTAQTENKGSLNPQFVYYLMGFPREWVYSVQQGMRLCRRWQQNLLKP
jgi:hypothetical protein